LHFNLNANPKGFQYAGKDGGRGNHPAPSRVSASKSLAVGKARFPALTALRWILWRRQGI